MTRRSSRRSRERPRRSLLVIVVVVLAALGLAFALIPGALPAPAPLTCLYGEVVLNGVGQCLPSSGP